MQATGDSDGGQCNACTVIIDARTCCPSKKATTTIPIFFGDSPLIITL
jgi:aerobic-type carbon monoxide dehydrogenase small subunit (CoxS/CutS family)